MRKISTIFLAILMVSPADCGLNIGMTGGFKDVAGKLDKKKEAQTAATDTRPPSVPTNFTAVAVSTSQINLSWTASTDNVGVTNYRVYRNASAIPTATPTGTAYSDTGLTVATAYEYTVSACDAAGNCSAQSTAALATTQANPPAILSLVANPTSISTGASTTIIVIASDPSGYALTYAWNSASGTIGGSGSQITWTAPASSRTYTVGVTVSNGHGGLVLGSVNVAVTASAVGQTAILTMSLAGAGSGTVTSSPAGINCGGTCSASYASGTQVTLTTITASGSTFTGWSGGGCSGTGACVVTMSAAQNVTATFNVASGNLLSLQFSGTGSGSITDAVSRMICTSNCSELLAANANVELSATANTGSVFAGFSGAGCNSAFLPTYCVMSAVNAAQFVTATFTTVSNYTLAVSTAGTGSGTVTSSPAGINCGSTCSASYASGTQVMLTTTTASGSTFVGWSGGGCSGTGTCVVKMSAAQAVTATFTLPNTLTVSLAGTGSGTVTSSPTGINCGSTCSASYASGTQVMLTTTTASGSTFTGWNGGGCSGSGACVVTMSAAQSVTATFNLSGSGTQKWAFATGGIIDNSSPAIGSDGTVYVTAENFDLYAINPNGTQKWAFAPPGNFNLESSPAIGSDGTIYVSGVASVGGVKNLYAVNPNGTQKWAFAGVGGALASLAIGSDGTIYGSDSGNNLYAINPNGTQKWAFSTGNNPGSSPAIGSDGTIYICGGNNLYAINPNGAQKWAFAMGNSSHSSPAIGSDGTVYVGSDNDNLYAINPNGTQKWAFVTGSPVFSSPAIGSDGTVYVGSLDQNLYAINPNGTQKWAFVAGSSIQSSPAIGSDGTVYVGCEDGNLYAINPNGTQKWTFDARGTLILVSPAIDSDGTIYVGSTGGNLYAIFGSGTLASSAWPKFHHDLLNSGRYPSNTLTVSLAGTGSGTVTSSPAGINCGSTCSASYASGAAVTMTVTAANGSTFTGWSGGGCSGTGTCVVTMSVAQSVMATFTSLSSGANLVIGQANFTSNTSGTSNSAMHWPYGVAFDGSGNLWVSEYDNNRILEFKPPFSVGMSASLVLGQPNFTSNTSGASQSAMYYPEGIAVDGSGNLWVADHGNGRILEFKPPFSNGMNASLPLGQPNVGPSGIAVDGSGNVWVSDQGGNRVLEFQPPFSSGMNASLVFGQPNFTSNTAGLSQSAMSDPEGIAMDGAGNLWVSDAGNNRALEFKPPFSNDMNASLVLGQSNFASNTSGAITLASCS